MVRWYYSLLRRSQEIYARTWRILTVSTAPDGLRAYITLKFAWSAAPESHGARYFHRVKCKTSTLSTDFSRLRITRHRKSRHHGLIILCFAALLPLACRASLGDLRIGMLEIFTSQTYDYFIYFLGLVKLKNWRRWNELHVHVSN